MKQKILVIQQKMIGDVLASTIICNNLRLIYPDSQIDYLIYPFTKPVVENNPNIDNVILFEDRFKKSKKDFLLFLFQVRNQNYDIIIDAYGKIESNMIVAFSGAQNKISFHKWYSQFLYHATLKNKTKTTTNIGFALQDRLDLLHFLNSKVAIESKPKIFLTEKEIQNGKKILEKHQIDFTKKIFMIGVLGSGYNKTYPFPYMAKMLDTIVEMTEATLLFNYMPSQIHEAKAIFDLCQIKTQKNIKIEIIPGSIREFLSITYHCNALIGNEGGAVNMAKAISIPTFTIFSTWINKESWNSFEDGKEIVSVHLKDFKPELYNKKTPKEMKNKALELYNQFLPEFIIPKLTTYLKG
jgi:ADP-heptose:LPS heptosyltransferase